MTGSHLAASLQRRNDLQNKREKLANEIRAMAAESDSWSDGDRQAWESKNAEYDSVMNVLAPLQRIGRDGGRIGDPVSSEMFGAVGTVSDYDNAISAWARSAAGLPVPANEYQSALNCGFDPRSAACMIPLPQGAPTRGLQIQNSLSVQDGSSGGFTVGSSFMTKLSSALKAYSGMMQTAEVWITPDGRESTWPTCDDTSNTGEQIGENTESDELDLAFGGVKFGSYKMTSKLVKVPHELLRDSSVNLAGAIGAKLGERLGRIVNTKATTGSGAATLHGIATQATVGKTCASATGIAFDELIELQHSVDSAYRSQPGTGWQMNDLTASHIRRLKDGDGQYLWRDSVQEGQPPLLLGNPVTINQDLADIATGAIPVVYGKLDEYKLRVVGGVRLRQLQERYAEYDQVGFLAFMEVDGAILKTSATASLCPIRSLQMA